MVATNSSFRMDKVVFHAIHYSSSTQYIMDYGFMDLWIYEFMDLWTYGFMDSGFVDPDTA